MSSSAAAASKPALQPTTSDFRIQRPVAHTQAGDYAAPTSDPDRLSPQSSQQKLLPDNGAASAPLKPASTKIAPLQAEIADTTTELAASADPAAFPLKGSVNVL
ncbi:MAG: hypothetical protein ACREBW_05540, partial [Candidatus Micrarchaeaceae archaeon]